MNLIIGAGLIGRHLHYRLRGDAVLFSRRDLDLSTDSWEIPKCSTAYICAGETNTEKCEQKAEETRLVNVTNTVKLAKELVRNGSEVVWVSSERVYDGSVPYRKVTDAVCPVTEYGRQKAEAERELVKIGVTVVRFAKVLGWEVPLFEGWIQRLKNNEVIHPYNNQRMAPVSVSFAVGILSSVRGGLFQVSGDLDISYSQIAYHIANQMGKHLSLVQPIEGESHLYATLECSIPGIDIPDSWEVIEEWCRNRLLY